MNENLFLDGSLEKIIFKSEKDNFLIGIFLSEEEYFTVVGYLPKHEEGTKYRIWGDFTYHKKYGEQFKVEKAQLLMPKGEEEIIAFLSSNIIKGIGEQKARAIVSKFGDKTIEIIEKHPEELLTIKDIGKKTLEKIIESFSKYGRGYKVFNYFQSLGISTLIINRIYDIYGEDAIKFFEENPYEFSKDIKGLGFLKLDKIALASGIREDDPHRIKMGLEYILMKEASLGNVYCEKELLCLEAKKILSVDEAIIEDCLYEMALDLRVKIEFQRNDVYLIENIRMEEYVAEKIFELSQDKRKLEYEEDGLIKDTEKAYGIEFSEEQKDAIKGCLNSPISIITGGPGTGKTTIIRGLIKIFESESKELILAAPTGRAAKRITETTGRSAKTIHRMLEYYADENQVMKFNKKEDNPLDEDVIILDETSMVDLQLMYSILRAVKEGGQLILVGDEDQLQSVGIGNVLGDLIKSGKIPCFRLENIFRQAKESKITTCAHEINKGIKPIFENDREGDLFYIEKIGENEVLKTIKDLVSFRLESFFDVRDKVVDIQIISPSKKGLLGNENINIQIQDLLNPPSSEKEHINIGELTIRCKDKVMHTRNNYNIKWVHIESQKEGMGIFNGEIGIVEKIDKEEELVYILFDDEKLAVYDYEDMRDISLGYSMTVHKSQGSEFDVVVIPLYRVSSMLSHRNLIYTGITRGKKGVVLVGDRRYLDVMIENKYLEKRKSNLANRIINYFENL